MSSYPQANDGGPLYNADNLPAYDCGAAAATCWYQVDPCDTGTSNWIAYGTTDPETGECPPMPEDHTWSVAPGECYTVLAGAAGTTTTPETQLPIAFEVFSCDDCADLVNCFGCDPDCVVESVTVTAAGYVTKPEWCPSDALNPGGYGTPREQMLTDDLVNGIWTALPTSTSCQFDFRVRCTAADPVATLYTFDGEDVVDSEDATDCFMEGTVISGGSMSQLAAVWTYPSTAEDNTNTNTNHFPLIEFPPGDICDAGGVNFDNAGTGSPCPADPAYNECDDWQGTSPGLFGRPTCGGTIKLVANLVCDAEPLP